MVDKALIVVWSLLLSYLTILMIGSTAILSTVFGSYHLKTIVDLLTFILIIVFSTLLWLLLPRPLPKKSILSIVTAVIVLFFIFV